MSYTVAYCQECRVLQFEPEELGAREAMDLCFDPPRARELYAICRVCQGQPRKFTRVDDLSDL